MERKRKKVPSDYPQFSFRLTTAKEKDDLVTSINAIRNLYNEEIDKKTERKFNLNDIIMEALRIGLSEMKKRKR
jgi:hypothetical protein